jgi:hypothetical protein
MASSFNYPPKGEGSWMTTQVHKILNCEIEEFNVTQDCTNCPIKSPFGILNPNPQSNNDTLLHKGHLTFLWNKPRSRSSNCSYKIIRQSRALLYDAENLEIQHIRDIKNQLEFIINGTPEKICNFEHSFKVKGIEDTFIRYSRAPVDKINHTIPTHSEQGTFYNFTSTYIVNDRTNLCLGKPESGNEILRAVNCDSENAVQFLFLEKRLIPRSNQDSCVTVRTSNLNIIYRNCQPQLARNQKWNYNSSTGLLWINSEKTKTNNITKHCLSLSVFSHHNRPNNDAIPNLIDCKDRNELFYPQWKFMEKNTFQADAPEIIDEASHHQYTSGTLVEISNQLNDEIRNVYCESLKTKQFLAMTTAQSSPMLAGIILGLPTCQRVQADGQTMIIQQCKKTTVKVEAHKTKCGFEPKFNGYTIGKDGFTRTKFRPCTWSNGLVNLNGKTFEYVNESWTPIKPNIKISSIGLKSHFEEEVDIEAKYLHNLETSFHSKENEQMNMIGELMAVMQHDTINPISPILTHFDEKTRFDWSWTNWFSNFTSFFTIIPILIICLVIYIFCLRNNNTADSSSSEHVYYHQPFPFIPPTPESTPAIRRTTWTVPQIFSNISQAQPRSPPSFSPPPPPVSTPSSRPITPSTPSTPSTPNVPTLRSVLPIFPVPTPIAPPIPPINTTILPLPSHKLTPSLTIPPIEIDTPIAPPQTESIVNIEHDHTDPRYVVSKGYCWKDGCPVFTPLNSNPTPAIPVPRKRSIFQQFV